MLINNTKMYSNKLYLLKTLYTVIEIHYVAGISKIKNVISKALELM